MSEKIDLDFLKLRPLRIPSAIPQRPARETQANVPGTRAERERLNAAVKAYVAENKGVLTPPVPFEDLKVHADELLKFAGADPIYREFLAILLNNETWRDVLATIPFNRRLLLLPVCLRVENDCPAPFDEFGLLCKECGQCSIHYLKEEADRLGYATLVAEGTPIVLRLIETGQIEAVVGVSCISVLERVFPYMEQAAAPGIAIPLLQDDCADTNIDIEWLWDVIHLTSDDRTYRMNLDDLRGEVSRWFTPESLAEIVGEEMMKDPTGAIAYEWMARDGKRWRPFLTACAWHAYQPDATVDGPKPDDLKKLAVAVEAFHKASLVHDDIEDEDDIRYDAPTVHAEQGVPVALNVGDFLLGEGYRLIAEAMGVDGERRARMLHMAALGHRTLSMGQGAELLWTNNPKPMTSRKVLDIFRKKTAPAFEVALLLGALLGEADDATLEIIQNYSEALGIAYQIRDDLDDIGGTIDSNDTRDIRPSLLLALAHERAKGEDKAFMKALWCKEVDSAENEARVQEILHRLEIPGKAQALLDGYKDEAVRALRTLENPSLKGLLRRVLGRIFKEDGPETFAVSMRLEMLQVARLSPNLLGDSAKLVEAFIRGQQHESGAFVDLDGRPDLYYTVFAMNGLAALQAELEGDQKSALEKYLDTFQDVTRLDYVHLCCLARALAGKEDARRDAIAEELETYRSADGGYNAGEKGAETGSVYGCFLALGAVQDIERELPNPEGIIACVESMQTPDGAYANEAALPMGTTTTTAAAIEIFRVLGREIDPEVGHWMLSQMHPEGGFYAMPAAPIPDLLTTATVLHALAGIQVSFEPVKEHVLDFIDTLWTNRGGFYGNWMEETVDVEYTFYGLLALGHLSL